MAEKLVTLVPLFEALADENRLKILTHTKTRALRCTLDKNGECKDQTCIKDIKKHLNISLSTISYHIKILVRSGLLQFRKEGTFSYLEVPPEKFRLISSYINNFK